MQATYKWLVTQELRAAAAVCLPSLVLIGLARLGLMAAGARLDYAHVYFVRLCLLPN